MPTTIHDINHLEILMLVFEYKIARVVLEFEHKADRLVLEFEYKVDRHALEPEYKVDRVIMLEIDIGWCCILSTKMNDMLEVEGKVGRICVGR